MKESVNHACVVVAVKIMNLGQKLAEQRAEGYVDTTVKILITAVLGALLLAGPYALFNDTVLSTLVREVQEMLDYAG